MEGTIIILWVLIFSIHPLYNICHFSFILTTSISTPNVLSNLYLPFSFAYIFTVSLFFSCSLPNTREYQFLFCFPHLGPLCSFVEFFRPLSFATGPSCWARTCRRNQGIGTWSSSSHKCFRPAASLQGSLRAFVPKWWFHARTEEWASQWSFPCFSRLPSKSWKYYEGNKCTKCFLSPSQRHYSTRTSSVYINAGRGLDKKQIPIGYDNSASYI